MEKNKIIEKMKSCKALEGKTVLDVLEMPEFAENLGKYFEAQKSEWHAARESLAAQRKIAGTNRLRLPAHTLDKLVGWSTEMLRQEFVAVVQKTSKQPYAVREYVGQLGMQAYNVTVANFVIAEFPDTKDFFYPSTNKN